MNFPHLSLTHKMNIPQNREVIASDDVFSVLVFKHISWLAKTFQEVKTRGLDSAKHFQHVPNRI